MEDSFKREFKDDINGIVDLMIQQDAIREQISELKKELKGKYDIPVATLTKISTIIRKQSLNEEEEKWEEIKNLVEICN
jgi:hypothetical protein